MLHWGVELFCSFMYSWRSSGEWVTGVVDRCLLGTSEDVEEPNPHIFCQFSIIFLLEHPNVPNLQPYISKIKKIGGSSFSFFYPLCAVHQNACMILPLPWLTVGTVFGSITIVK